MWRLGGRGVEVMGRLRRGGLGEAEARGQGCRGEEAGGKIGRAHG